MRQNVDFVMKTPQITRFARLPFGGQAYGIVAVVIGITAASLGCCICCKCCKMKDEVGGGSGSQPAHTHTHTD